MYSSDAATFRLVEDAFVKRRCVDRLALGRAFGFESDVEMVTLEDCYLGRLSGEEEMKGRCRREKT